VSKWVVALVTALAVVALDQLTKVAVATRMQLHETIPLVDGFVALTYVRNTGAAFGIFSGRALALRVPFFLAISGAAVALLVWFLRGVAVERRLLIVACGAAGDGAARDDQQASLHRDAAKEPH